MRWEEAVHLRQLALAGILVAVLVSIPDILRCQTTAATRSALTNQDVIDLVKAGFSTDIVLAKIRSSACNFDTSLAAMKNLKNANVPDSVVLAMVQVSPAKDDRPLKASYPTMQEILDKSVQALGGEAAIRKLSSTYISGTFEDHGKTGTFEIYSKAPNKKLVVRRAQGSETREGFDGLVAWNLSPQTPVRQITGQELSVASRDADFYQSFRLPQLYPKMTLVSGNRVGERPVYTIQADPGDGTFRRMYFDVDSGLLLQNDLEYETPHGHVTSSWRFEDYRAADGVQVPFVRRNAADNYTIRVSEVHHDVPIDEGGFAKPMLTVQAAPSAPSSTIAPAPTPAAVKNPPPSSPPIKTRVISDDTNTASRVLTVVAVSHSAQESDYIIPGQTNTNCATYGSSVNCNTTEMPSRNGAVYRFTQVVTANGLTYTLSRTARWRWNSLDWLEDGEAFPAEINGKKMTIAARKGGNQGKKETLKYDILDIR
jgi:hypothetical protein